MVQLDELETTRGSLSSLE